MVFILIFNNIFQVILTNAGTKQICKLPQDKIYIATGIITGPDELLEPSEFYFDSI